MTFFDPEAAAQSTFGVPCDNGELGNFKNVWASRARDKDVAAAGQGGGTITALMATALESGLIDCAVLTATVPDQDYPRGGLATTSAEIRSCAGSKYVGAHSLISLRTALNSGLQRIGVVGLPCQVRALRKMALYDLKEENTKARISIVAGLFCNWAFSSREFASFLAGRFQSGTVRRFDIPPPPADTLEIDTDEGLESIPLDEVRPLIQAACNVCGDMTSEFADFSVGMYEGRDGWNTLITRSETGHALVEKARGEGVLEVDAFPEANLNHLKAASANKRKRLSDDE